MTSESWTPAGTVSIMRVNRDPHVLLNSSGEDEYLHNTKILETWERRRYDRHNTRAHSDISVAAEDALVGVRGVIVTDDERVRRRSVYVLRSTVPEKSVGLSDI